MTAAVVVSSKKWKTHSDTQHLYSFSFSRFFSPLPVDTLSCSLGTGSLAALWSLFGVLFDDVPSEIGRQARFILGIVIAPTLLFFYGLKIVFAPSACYKDMFVGASSCAAGGMSFFVIAKHINDEYETEIGEIVWCTGLCVYSCYSFWFVRNFVYIGLKERRGIEFVTPGWVVPLVGVATGAANSAGLNVKFAAQICWLYGCFWCSTVLPLVNYRLFYARKPLERNSEFQLAFLTAPTSLLTYSRMVLDGDDERHWYNHVLYFVATVMYITVLVHARRLLLRPFHPRMAMYTFSLGISAAASLGYFARSDGQPINNVHLLLLGWWYVLTATGIILYVLFGLVFLGLRATVREIWHWRSGVCPSPAPASSYVVGGGGGGDGNNIVDDDDEEAGAETGGGGVQQERRKSLPVQVENNHNEPQNINKTTTSSNNNNNESLPSQSHGMDSVGVGSSV